MNDPRRANGTRRNKLRHRVLCEEDVCWLCGDPVDKSLPSGHPMSASLDEIVPISRGGDPLDRKNIRLAHLLHNQQRGGGRRSSRPVTRFVTTRSWEVPA